MPHKKIKLNLRTANVAASVEHLVLNSEHAKVSRTGYTVTVETERHRYYFAEGGFSRRGFAAAGAAKRDALNGATVDTDTGEIIDWAGVPGCDSRAPRYFNIPTDAVLPSEAVCIDIRAAYPYTLANLGIVTPPTFDKLMKLKKPDRLKAVGMLGTTKHIQTFERARLTLSTVETSPTAPAFFATCKHVGEVMSEAAAVSGRAFLLFWVDGIFVYPDAVEAVTRTLRGYGYDYTTEKVENLRRSLSGRFLFYTKGGKSTYLCPPRRVEFDATELVERIKTAKDDA